MAELKLAKLPDRTPVKITISISPDLSTTLKAYAVAYRAVYGQEETLSDLIPLMLAGFMESDKAFTRWRRDAADRND
jgi:hypothetical protein